MKPQDAIEHLDRLDTELHQLQPSWRSQEFVSWEMRTRGVLSHALGEEHAITQEFLDTHWASVALDDALDMRQFNESRIRVHGMLEAARAEIELFATEASIADQAGIDPELWERVAPEIQTQAWDKVASQAVIFTEDRIRKWAGRPLSEVGKGLAVAVFGAAGSYKMGLTPGEEIGWQLFAQGIAQTLRNTDTHRIQQRADHRRYALGVVGACSLLLTQMRYEHGNRFHDTSPASSHDGDST